MTRERLCTFQPKISSDPSYPNDILIPKEKQNARLPGYVTKISPRTCATFPFDLVRSCNFLCKILFDLSWHCLGLMYHPHLRPLSTPLAAILDISANFHRSPPFNLPLPLPADVLRVLASRIVTTHHAEEESWRQSAPTPRNIRTSGEEPEWMSDSSAASSSHVPISSLMSLANLLEIPPIHVDQVADAIIEAIRDPEVRGPVGVDGMRELIGWHSSSSRSELPANAELEPEPREDIKLGQRS